MLQRTLSAELLRNFVVYVMGKVMELEAPAHVKETQKATDDVCAELEGEFRPGLVVKALKLVMRKVRELQEQVAQTHPNTHTHTHTHTHPRPPTAHRTRPVGPPRREARENGPGMRDAVGARASLPLVACCVASQPSS